MGKIIVTLFPFTDIPSGMKPSATKSSVLTRHPGSALNSRKVPKMPCFCGFYGVGSNEPVDEPSGFKRRGKIKLYQRRSYYAQNETTQFGWFSFCAVSMFTVATDGFPEHNCQALPVGYTAQGVVAQRSKFIGAPSRNKFWAPQECKQWLCHCAKGKYDAPATTIGH